VTLPGRPGTPGNAARRCWRWPSRLSPAPCLRREANGYIRGYVPRVDPTAVDRALTVFITVRLERHTTSTVSHFEAEILKDPAVLECYRTAGGTDYLVKVAVADLDGLDRFLLQRLTQIPGVATIHSGIAIRQVKYSTALPID
jgi:Lrp/AsnC family leucine-responsive transcriptional regulator